LCESDDCTRMNAISSDPSLVRADFFSRTMTTYSEGGDWQGRTSARLQSFQLRGLRLGIIGMGAIGHRVARIGHFGFETSVQATVSSSRELPAHVQAVDLSTLCSTSDLLVVCTSLNDATRGLLGRKELALLPAGGVLVNVARGAVIDEEALVAFANDPERKTFLVLDVFHESPLDPRHSLVASNASLLTPHMAGITREAEREVGFASARVIQALLAARTDNLNFLETTDESE